MAKPWEQDFTAGADSAPSPAKKPWEQSFTAAPAPEAGIQAKDLGLALKKGVERVPGSLTGLADAVLGATTGADRPVGRLADLLGEVTGFQPSKMAQADEASHSSGYKAQKAQLDQAWEGSGANALSRLLLSPGEWDQVPEAWAKLDGKALAKAVRRTRGRRQPPRWSRYRGWWQEASSGEAPGWPPRCWRRLQQVGYSARWQARGWPALRCGPASAKVPSRPARR